MAVLMLSGCVMKSDYMARVADIEGLQKAKASLEEKNQLPRRRWPSSRKKTKN